MRVTGFGNLDLVLNSLQNVDTESLEPISMQSSTSIEPTVLALFVSQRVQLDLSVNVLGEAFSISKIYIYVKPIAASYPM